MEAIKQVLSSARFIEVCPPPVEARNFAAVLRQRALSQPDDLAYVFLAFGRAPDLVKTYREVDASANGIARALIERGLAGRNVVLAYSSAREFLEAFFGCLYAGCVAVPALPPDDERERKRLIGIVRDCDPGIVLTTRGELDKMRDYFREMGTEGVECTASESFPPSADPIDVSGIDGSRLAFLQYTSGSTAEPKGVMVSHANLLHNEEVIAANMGSREIRWLSCSWLPHYHDMGLIGGILHPFHIGRPVVLYATTDFLQQPMRWLKLISELGVSMSGAPNFAYDLCVKRSKRFDISQLDLSRWILAFNGAEPVREEVLGKFFERFMSCGFRPDAMVPGYGLAEATLMVTSRRLGEELVRMPVDYERLTQGRFEAARAGAPSVTLIGNGLAGRDVGLDIRLIDPETGRETPQGVVGEICVRGDSICGGYYAKPELSAETFDAYAEIYGGRGFLRTGDLGFVDGKGQLFVTGRLKDVVIWNGANHYPQDIELVIEEACDQIRGGRVAVFNLNAGHAIGVMAVGEVSPASASPETLEALATGIRDAVMNRIGIPLAGIAFIAKGSTPRTSSGKIRRAECRKRYLESQFEIVHEWNSPAWKESLDRLRERADRTSAASLLV